MVETSLAKSMQSDEAGDKNFWPSSSLLDNRPYAENIKIRDSWRGWFDYPFNGTFENTKSDANYQQYVVDEKDCYSAAYIGHFELSEDIDSLSLTFHKFNGIAWIYCNGEFIDQIGDRTPVFNLKAFADYCTLIPENGKLDVVIVIACEPKVQNPGLLSEPIIETRTANDIRTALTAGHFAIVTMLFLIAIGVGSNIILGATKNKRLFFAFFTSFVAILFYYLTDCRFISVNSHVRADMRFVLLIIASTASFIENSQLFAGTKTQKKYPLIRKAHHGVIALAVTEITAYFICDWFFGLLSPEFVALLVALLSVTLAIFINLFFYNKENQRILLWALMFSLMFLILYLSILMDSMIVYTIPTYSTIFVVFTVIAELSLVSSYISQQKELQRSAAILKRQVREKTVFSSRSVSGSHSITQNCGNHWLLLARESQILPDGLSAFPI